MIRAEASFKEDPKFRRVIEQAMKQALEQTADRVIGDLRLSQTMPMDTGHLQNVQTSYLVTENGVELVSSTPYARRLYFNPQFNFRTDKNPHAGGLWFDPYLDGGSKNKWVLDTYSQTLRKELD